MRARQVNENDSFGEFDKFRKYLISIKEKLKSSLSKNASHRIIDKGDDLIAIATGDEYSTLIKILGYDKIDESLNEARFSALEIPFNREDVKDKTLDVKFYVEEIEHNLTGIDLTTKGFKFDEAFSKLKKCIDDIIKATDNHIDKDDANEALNNVMLYKENKNKAKSNKYPLLGYNYE